MLQNVEVLRFVINSLNLGEWVITLRLFIFTYFILTILLFFCIHVIFFKVLIQMLFILLIYRGVLTSNIIQIVKQFIAYKSRKVLVVLKETGKLLHYYLIPFYIKGPNYVTRNRIRLFLNGRTQHIIVIAGGTIILITIFMFVDIIICQCIEIRIFNTVFDFGLCCNFFFSRCQIDSR